MPEMLPRTDTAPAAAAGRAGRLCGRARARGPRVAGRPETLVFRLAMAAAALWVLDDAFWHREPGTVGRRPPRERARAGRARGAAGARVPAAATRRARASPRSRPVR